jgi:hypothetical protein
MAALSNLVEVETPLVTPEIIASLRDTAEPDSTGNTLVPAVYTMTTVSLSTASSSTSNISAVRAAGSTNGVHHGPHHEKEKVATANKEATEKKAFIDAYELKVPATVNSEGKFIPSMITVAEVQALGAALKRAEKATQTTTVTPGEENQSQGPQRIKNKWYGGFFCFVA